MTTRPKKKLLSMYEYIKEADFEYSTKDGAAYLIPPPANTLSPYEIEQTLNTNTLHAHILKTTIYDNSTTISTINKEEAAIICLVNQNMTDEYPNAMPIGILRLKKDSTTEEIINYQKNQRITTPKEPAKTIIQRLIATYANILTIQGYDIITTSIDPDKQITKEEIYKPSNINKNFNQNLIIQTANRMTDTREPISRYEQALGQYAVDNYDRKNNPPPNPPSADPFNPNLLTPDRLSIHIPEKGEITVTAKYNDNKYKEIPWTETYEIEPNAFAKDDAIVELFNKLSNPKPNETITTTKPISSPINYTGYVEHVDYDEYEQYNYEHDRRVEEALIAVATNNVSMAHAADYILTKQYKNIPIQNYMTERTINL